MESNFLIYNGMCYSSVVHSGYLSLFHSTSKSASISTSNSTYNVLVGVIWVDTDSDEDNV